MENRKNCLKYYKNLLAQEVRQKRDISDRRKLEGASPPSTLTLFATRPLGHCAICKGLSYTKNEYNLYHQKLDAEYLFI